MKNNIFRIFALMLCTLTSQAENTSAKNKIISNKEVIGTGGFKTLNVNNIRNFSITNSTAITIDGVIQDYATFEVIGTGGYKIRFKVANDVNPTISQGTLEELQLISDIKGPITGLNPLSVLDQELFSIDDTRLIGLSDISNLSLGNELSVSGAIESNNNSLQLSRIEKHSNALTEWKLRGTVSNITTNTFMIGNLTINRNMVTPLNCNNGFVNNVFVSIKATPDASYQSGNPLITLTNIECETPDVDQTPNDSIPSVIEGFVSEIINFESFRMNDLTVYIDVSTQFDNGGLEHIDIGSKIELQGLLNTNTREVTASTVRFIHHRIKIIAPASPAEIGNNSLQLFNKTILTTPQTQDDDLVLVNGISTDRQIEVHGFIDSNGQMYALRIRNRDTADSQDVRLRGSITAINKPMMEINNIQIDATSSEFEQLTGLVDTDIDTFFNSIQVGMQASIEYASYDSNTQVLSLGQLEIEEEELEDNPDDLPNKSSATNNTKEVIGTGGVGLATITIPEKIFNSGFE